MVKSKKEVSKEAINILERSDNKLKFQCMLCKDGDPHMIVIMNKDGDIHVHAPFDNKYAISQLIDAVVEEQKKYNSK